MIKFNKKFALAIGLIIVAICSRFVTHIPNLTPVMAIALFSGTVFSNKRLAFALPLTAMFISDLFIGLHPALFAVYSSLAIAVIIGFYLKRNLKASSLLISSLAGSIIFFIITNLASFFIDPVYLPHSFASLVRCYTMALPFFRNELAGSLLYNFVIFGAYKLAESRLPVLARK